jgi:hypothetical protein
MSQQNYKNHVRYHPPHHFFFIPFIAVLLIGSIWCATRYTDDRLVWTAISAAFFMIGFMGVMMRQHYALGNQDRIVRLEMRLRYFQLTGERLEHYERMLSQAQIAALRFASDEELVPLLQRALDEQLTPDAIKRSIHQWVPDEMRR